MIYELRPAEDYKPVIPKKGEIAEVTWKINTKTMIITRDVVIKKEEQIK